MGILERSDEIQAQPTSTSDLRVLSRLARRVLGRLDARSRLRDLALEVFQGLSDSGSRQLPGGVPFVGEANKTTGCNVPEDAADVLFECSTSSFSCAPISGSPDVYTCGSSLPGGTFECEDTFGTCDDGIAGASYNCDDSTSPAFDCSDSYGVYDCHHFICGGESDGDGAFDCDAEFDFLCTGPDFDCHDDFDCTASHVFLCADEHDCVDTFDCTSEGCGEEKYDCTDTDYPYTYPDDGGTDTTPGDFRCGHKADGDETFTCAGTFTCASEDEFDCAGGAVFRCGKNDGTGSFVCDSDSGDPDEGNNFECDSDYKCRGSYCGCSQTSPYSGCCGGSTYSPPPP